MFKLTPTTSYRPSPFKPVDFSSASSLEKLNALKINTGEIDQKVESDVSEARSKQRTQDEFKAHLKKAKAWKPSLSNDEIFKWVLSSYKRNGITIKWLDIDEELSLIGDITSSAPATEPSAPEIEPEENKNFLSRALWKIPELWAWVAWAAWWAIKNVWAWLTASAPSIIWNTFWFAADVLTPKDLEWLGEFFRKEWERQSSSILEDLSADPEALTTKAWGFTWEVLSLFAPWTQVKTIAKWSWALWKVAWVVDDISQKSPELFAKLQKAAQSKITKSAAIGWSEAAKFEVVSEWEISPTTVAAWAVINPVIDKAGWFIKWVVWSEPIDKLFKAIKPTQVKWVKKWSQTKTIRENLWIILADIKSQWGKTQDILDDAWEVIKKGWEVKWMVGVLDFAQSEMKSLYTRDLIPALKWSSATSNLWNIAEQAYQEVIWTWKIQWVKKSELFWVKDDISKVTEVLDAWKKLWDNSSVLQVEEMKRYTKNVLDASRLQQKWWLSSSELQFFTSLNKKLETELDDKLSSVLWEWWATAIKRKYAAYANTIWDIDKRILQQARHSGVDLFQWLWIISWLTNIVEGIASWKSEKITSGFTSLFTWKFLNIIKNPDELVNKAIRDVLKDGSNTSIKEGIKSSASWVVKKWLRVWAPDQISDTLDEWELLR